MANSICSYTNKQIKPCCQFTYISNGKCYINGQENNEAGFLSAQKKLPLWMELESISFLPHKMQNNTKTALKN